jgi:hypothetical protein
MGWVSLSLRKLSLRANVSNLELRDIQISRTLRQTQRQLSYEQSIMKNDRAGQLRDIKEVYDAIKADRPEIDSDEYNEWYMEYQDAREKYEFEKNEIQTYFDDQLAMLEDEAADKEALLQQEQTTVEAQLEAARAELEAVSEQISADIESSAIKFN